MTERRPHILICYDGSRHAEAAIREAAVLFPEARADVLVVAEQGMELMAGAVPFALDADVRMDIDRRIRTDAQHLADAGVRLARDVRLVASPVVRLAHGSAWREIVECSYQAPYTAVVVGSRGRSAIRTALLGGVSMGVVAHCIRPVVVVHDPGVKAPPFAVTEDEDATQQLVPH